MNKLLLLLFLPLFVCAEVEPGTYLLEDFFPPGTIITVPDSAEPDPIPEPEPTPEPPTGYTRLGPLTGYNRSEGYPMPAYDSPEEGWAMIEAMCGKVGSWDKEITIPYQVDPYPSDVVKVKDMPGCVHIKGELGPNGEKPRIDGQINATKGYNGLLQKGGVLVENLEANFVGVPNDKHFLVMRNLYLHDWPDHAFITSGGNKHMYLELLDSHISTGNNNHAVYIDNIAFANVQRNKIESPGTGHALRSVAQKGIIKDNLLCSVYCDGTTRLNNKGQEIKGMAPLEVYANGSHWVEGNETRFYSTSPGYFAATLRSREGINSLDRYRDGDHYNYLVWGTPEFNNPATWGFPVLETVVKNHKTVCQGAPCYAWDVKSTYPYLHDGPKSELQSWWKLNKFPDWNTLLAHADPSWHGTLNLMDSGYRAKYLANGGTGLPNKIPFSVPDGWQQKARITFENLTNVNVAETIRPREYDGWCAEEIENGVCVNQEYYLQAEIVFKDGEPEPIPEPIPEPVPDPTPLPVSWLDAVAPYIPATPKTVRIIPDTAINAVLLKHDGSKACDYLLCNRSDIALIDWTGMSFDKESGCAYFIAPGGHQDLGANSVYKYCFGKGWSRLYDYSPPVSLTACDGVQDGPIALHSYSSDVYVPTLGMTVKVGNTGVYYPKTLNCTMTNKDLWGWKEGWVNLGPDPGFRFARTAYDSERDKIYFVDQGTNALNELDPHTLEAKKLRATWAGKGGAMTLQGRSLYWTAPNGGTYTATISLDGVLSPITKLIGTAWDNGGWGLSVSGNVLVGWKGNNSFAHFDLTTNTLEYVQASGDQLPESAGVNRIYSKFINVAPGIFIGIADNYGWIVYRAF